MTEEFNQVALIKKAMWMIMTSKIKEEMSPSDWLKALLAMHSRGFLYFIPTQDKKDIDVLFAGWRIENTKEDSLRNVPTEEKGDIFYVPFYLPRDKKLPMGAVRRFLKNTTIKSIVFEDNDDELREYKLRRRNKNGQKQVTKSDATKIRRRRTPRSRQKSSK